MRSTHKTTHYFVIFLIFVLGVIVYNVYFSADNITPTSDHATLTLTPFTAKEQKDLIRAQQAQEKKIDTGPLIATANATEAEAKVLNLNHHT
ncbi:MAG: hypothetical protein A3E82_01405 [Gammaproteobacteria bacterium RIFCSPHIGHO2_12_FULL_38_11]|nr:MAG: hypothetical protein A3E82_01405 [Gammaproteobacteria bacterium RIFCSPHIGHO2_12_FULL_38_11]